jgi:hypothetical protein
MMKNWRTITDANGLVALQRRVLASQPTAMCGWETVATGADAISEVYCAICFSMAEVRPGHGSDLCPAQVLPCEPRV